VRLSESAHFIYGADMPYKIVKRNGKYLVYKEDENGNPTGKALGTHDTLKAARQQQKAIYANETQEMWGIFTEQAGENKGYIYLSVNPGWEMDRIRDALNTVFGWDESWRWNDYYTLHITLAYCENISTEQLHRALTGAIGKPAMELKVVGVSTFDNPESNEKAVYLVVEKSNRLAELQRSIYDALVAEGVEISQFSNPEQWTPHITLAYAPMDSAVPEFTSQIYMYVHEVCAARSEYEEVSSVHLRWQDERMGNENGTGPMMEHAEWKIVPIEQENTGEITEMDHGKVPVRLTFISEFRGNAPKIELPPDIDLAELKREYKRIFGDDELEFVTLPIGKVNAESRNGRTYPEKPVRELVQQVNELRPEGMWGHLRDEELATRYDPPAIRWLAAMIDRDGVAWGKGLPLTVETRDYYRLARATRARVGTSLTAMAEIKENEVQSIELNTIDIADPRRVGILATVAMPHLTQEMKDTEGNEVPMDPNEDVIVRLRELQTTNGENSVMEETKLIEELTGERDSLRTQIAELQSKYDELNAKLTESTEREQGYRTTIGELLQEYIVAEVKEQVALEDARDLIVEQVIADQPQNRDAVRESVQKVLNKESVKKLLKNEIAREMGDPQPKQPRRNDNEKPEDKYLEAVPEITIPQREG
jgi:2'-5' RNA ligase